MVPARQSQASLAPARDFVDRIASWRSSPSTSDYSLVESSEEPLLARTESGWRRLPGDTGLESSDSDGPPARAPFVPQSRQKQDPQSTRRWLVGCFVVILLAGAGWRVSTCGSADLARAQGREDFPKPETQGPRLAAFDGSAPGVADDGSGVTDPHREPKAAAATASAEDDAASHSSLLPSWNVHPRPRPPSADKRSGSTIKYLAYENHSGFHNQRKSLVNALVLAQLLNRTLLLPPARLGHAMPWEPDPKHSVAFSERCKAGLEPDKPVAANPNSHLIGLREACDPPAGWTYVGWDYLIAPDLLEGHALVDRWNSSTEWITGSPERGGLGISRAADIHTFGDTARRSYQIMDSRDTAVDSSFESRIDLDDLRDPDGLGSKRLLHFGSLFSGSRLKLVDPANKALYDEMSAKMILRNEGLDSISDQVRDALGSYVAVHARVGDGVFKSHAPQNMHRLFQKLCTEVFGLPKSLAEKLYKDTRSRRPGSGHRSHGWRALLAPSDPARDGYPDVDEIAENEGDGDLNAAYPPSSTKVLRRSATDSSAQDRLDLRRRKPLRGTVARPLASHLRCRGALHDPVAAPHLAPLNTPLYIATDSRRPTSDANLAPFFRWFPCTFLLGDFSATGASAANEVNDEPIVELVRLAGGHASEDAKSSTTANRWISDWDGADLGRFLLSFLEAEIAARAVRVLGTHQSTFSGYTTTVLHDHYVENGLTATWDDRS
ncbi:hypothetical protein JCM3774_000864 [Rhodotorula dairenensis]